jgi:glycosyltransferase involved in cell wall biosynthesis
MRVLILDDAFIGWAGHNAGYNLSLCDELSRRSIAHQLFCQQDVTMLGDLRPDVKSVFKRSALAVSFQSKYLPLWLNRVVRVLAANAGHFSDLLSKVSPEVCDGDIVLVAIQSYRTSLAYGLWLLWLSMKRIRVTVVFIVHNVPHKYFGHEMACLRFLAWRQQIILAAHADPVAEHCCRATGHKCHLMPLPFAGGVDDLPANGRAIGDAGISFAYLGVAGLTKGVDLLVKAVDEQADLLRTGVIRFIIQIQCNVHMPNAEVENLRSRLSEQAARMAGIRLVTRSLVPDEYYREIDMSDVVIIPHRAEYYRCALSGIFADALARGKPVIVSDGTYMAKVLRQHGAGLLFPEGDAHGLSDAIRVAVLRIGELREKAFSARKAWRDIHNPGRYIDALLAISCADTTL